MKTIGLYIHIPFCARKCPYCDFFSVAADNAELDKYTEYTLQKLRSCRGKYRADTVYFGGGTPSLLGTERISALLDEISADFGKADEVTIEVNPDSAPSLDFAELHAHGLNRVSMGLQSANDGELELLGRLHGADDAGNAVRQIIEAGISNISLDLMLGIGGQTAQSLSDSISFAAALDVTHISAYMLKIEEGTPYYKIRTDLPLPDEDAVCDFYLQAVDELEKRGFTQYEISNFCKPGFESRHNLKYWHCEEYLGLGPSAHSFIDGKRYFYPRSFGDYYNDNITVDGEGGGAEEYIALALRLSEGLNESRFRERFGYPLPSEYLKNADALKNTDLIKPFDSGIALTPKGFLISNSIIAKILYG